MSGERVAERQTPQLSVGELAYDTARGALGVVMDIGTVQGSYTLRPPGGGIEWDVSDVDVRLATVSDRLRPALSEVNTRSRRGG
ncbi:hypothetical protein [Streptomyces albipurpureus]|uniref:PRC-barrel domain containing protein n=1 Tax=Streptomyces albipurpureus TaxID=2897419 RepID=A0ABT0UVF6_9ACTN|nr:hypothetical protein [Streptomyces sp. CWNU-1]MCM2392568.1 hypothetical protein [Streptomyces sp. CWNU-1]